MASNKTLSYTDRIGIKASSVVQIVSLIEKGIRYRHLTNLQKQLRMSISEIASAVEISERTLARRKKEGRLNPEESERLIRISRIYDKAVDLFEGDEDDALRWLQKPAVAFDDKTPLEFASTELGAREVENLIDRLSQGVFS